MKLAILGANGGCGRQLVQQAVERGHTVTAVVRSRDWAAPAGVRVERGDLTDEAFLRGALRGQDAVASALGIRIAGLGPWNRPEQPDFLSRSTPALVAAAKAEGVRRVVAISSGGVGDSLEKVPGFFRAMIAMTALRYSLAELNRMEQVLLASGLEVHIVRPSGLTDGPRTGQVKVVQGYVGRATISRADVAATLLDAVEAKTVPAERTPMISVTGVA